MATGLELRDWAPATWRDLPAAQQPSWPDAGALEAVLDRLRALPPLVFAGEASDLTAQLGRVSAGQAFLLQAGDCAESFDLFSADVIRDKLKVILQMAVVLTYGSGQPVVKMGRMAGQFAKPRSEPTEVVDGVELPSFRGFAVNDLAPDPGARIPDPARLLRAYHQSAATMNLLRAFTKGGFADLHQVQRWNQEFVRTSPQGAHYQAVAAEICRALRFMAACGIGDEQANLRQVDFWTCHEALLLGYEEALTRVDSLSGEWFDCSAHLLWVGERTRALDGAHVHFLAGIRNPLGVKLGPGATPEDAVGLCQALNPERIPGRLTLVTRLGAARVGELLPPLVRAVTDAGHPVVWACDPMHGNTYVARGGRKTRHFDDVLGEVRAFFAVHRAEGTWPGGLHVELTGEDVTECLGGGDAIDDDQLADRYLTACDPRLNARQALDLAFHTADLLRE